LKQPPLRLERESTHSGTTVNDAYACPADRTFELTTAEVGPAAAPI